jgi:hypothetical protein
MLNVTRIIAEVILRFELHFGIVTIRAILADVVAGGEVILRTGAKLRYYAAEGFVVVGYAEDGADLRYYEEDNVRSRFPIVEEAMPKTISLVDVDDDTLPVHLSSHRVVCDNTCDYYVGEDRWFERQVNNWKKHRKTQYYR